MERRPVKLKMLKRRLGRTNLEVSAVGFGGAHIQQLTQTEAVEVVGRAVKLGVNFIDTARSCGDSEDKIGKAIEGLKERPFISTKSYPRSNTGAAENIEKSCEKLKVDKFDLLFINAIDTEEELSEALAKGGSLEAAKEARKEGKVDYIGISGHQNHVLVEAIKTGEFDVVQAEYNVTNDDAGGELFALAQRLDVGVVVMKPLAGGFLAIPYKVQQVQIAGREVSVAEAALRFVLTDTRVSTVVPGMSKITEVEENVPLGYVLQQLSADEINQLRQYVGTLGYTFCQGCGDCLCSCREHIDIREVFRLLVYHDEYGMVNYTKARYQERHADKVKFCGECQSCVERCPAGLLIPVLLRKANSVLGS